jgi:hypothetical protein
MINIFIALLATAVGIYIGSIVFEKGTTETEPKPDRNSPMVICMVFHKNKPLTKETLLNDCLKPRAIQIARHFGLPFIPVDKELWKSLDKLADQIMQWWNPDYNELVLVAHRETPESSVVLNWTWAVPSTGVVDELGK